MNDKPDSNLTLRHTDSPLVPSQARSALVARGRRDAAALTDLRDLDPPPVPLSESAAKKLAEQGDAEAQWELGWIYSSSAPSTVPHGANSTDEFILREGPRNFKEAFRWYRRAADQGHASAQFSLGEMYYRGQGMQQNYVEAAHWYQKAADQGDSAARYALGRIHFNGEGVSQNYAEALSFYRKAADQGNALRAIHAGRHVLRREGGSAGLRRGRPLVSQGC